MEPDPKSSPSQDVIQSNTSLITDTEVEEPIINGSSKNSAESIVNNFRTARSQLTKEEMHNWILKQIKQVQSEISQNISVVMEAQAKLDAIMKYYNEEICENHHEQEQQLQQQSRLNVVSEEVPDRQPRVAVHNVNSEASATEERDWFTEVKPLKSPYCPQLGDLIVYFRQGHQSYLETVEKKRIYTIDELDEPWVYMDIKAHEYVKVTEVTYEMNPPRLCNLQLERLDKVSGQPSGERFAVRYHDVEDVVDFMVLRQIYDRALGTTWQKDSRFRCVIENKWYFGRIVSIRPLDDEFHDSLFKRCVVRWDDDGKVVELSPWELEPVADDQDPVLPEETCRWLYQPEPEEWPSAGREATCCVILKNLDKLIELPNVELLTNLHVNSVYASEARYSIDLSIVRSRLKYCFYRRLIALRFDAEHLVKNIEEVGERLIKDCNHDSRKIARDFYTGNYKLITDILLKLIDDPKEHDVYGMYEDMLNSQDLSDSNEASVSSYRPSVSSLSRSYASIEDAHPETMNVDWKVACQRLLNTLWENQDSIPFREPVNPLVYPDYNRVITNPMCLRNVQEDLEGEYSDPLEFSKDMNLIFSNSWKYTPNKQTEIYKQTARLKKIFKEPMERIISSWQSTNQRKNSNKNHLPATTNPSKRKRNDVVSPPKRQKRNINTNEAGPSRTPKKHPTRFGNAFFQNSRDSEASDWNESESSSSEETISKRRTRSKTRAENGKRHYLSKRENNHANQDSEDDDDNDDEHDESDDTSNSSNSNDNDDDLISSDDDAESSNTSESNSSSDDESDSSNYSNNEDEEVEEGSQNLSQISFLKRLPTEKKQHIDLTCFEKKRCCKHVASTKLQAKDQSNSFTRSDLLRKVQVGQRYVCITGKVVDVEISDPFSKDAGTNLDLLTFIIDNNDGLRVYCKAWENEARRYETKIKENHIIYIEKAAAVRSTSYNQGNVKYELLIKEYTKLHH